MIDLEPNQEFHNSQLFLCLKFKVGVWISWSSFSKNYQEPTDDIDLLLYHPAVLLSTLFSFQWLSFYSHFSFTSLPVTCFLLSILALFFLFFSLPTPSSPVHPFFFVPSDYAVSNATHRFNSTFTSHCRSSPQFIPFSVLFLWLSVKL